MSEPRCPVCDLPLTDLPWGKGLCGDPDCPNHQAHEHNWRRYEYAAGDQVFVARLCPTCGELDYMRMEQPRPDSQSRTIA